MQVPLQTNGGLVASMRPSDLPDGASPRTYDTDFVGGAVFQRPGEQSVYTYAGVLQGPNPAFAAVDGGGGNPWTTPTNILLNDTNYATALVGQSGSVAALSVYALQSGSGSSWSNLPAMVGSGPSAASVANSHLFHPNLVTIQLLASIPSNATITGVSVTLQAEVTAGYTPNVDLFFNLAALRAALINSTSFGAYNFGSSSDLWGQAFTAAAFASGIPLYLSVSSNSSAGTLSIYGVVATVYYTINASNNLEITEFTFSIPNTQGITGVSVSVSGYGPGVGIGLQLVSGGAVLGALKTALLPSSLGVITLGGVSDSWGSVLNIGQINATSFGVQLYAAGVGTAHLNYITVTVYLTGGATNFNFFKSFQTEAGVDYNLALDANGNWWLENITEAPGELTLALGGTTADSYGSGATVYDRAFVANTNLSGALVTGSDIPRQYNFDGGWWDRITQVGPAAPPSFGASQAAAGVANITAISVSGGIATVTAAQTYTAGEVGTFAGITGGLAALNGQTLIVLSTGLSGTQFEVATGATGSYSGSGATFTPQYVYPVTSITQPAAYSDPGDAGHLSVLLWSAGPGSTSTGNTITVYYQSSFNYPTPDTTLVAAFNSGEPVYVYITNAPFGNGIYQVTSIGNALPPQVSHWRYYFTIQVPTSSYQISIEPTGQYEITQGTITMASAVPGLAPGAQVSIAGASVAAWDGVYPIVQALNAGAYNITQTALSAGTATFTWALVSGAAPAAGQLVTITNTLNANGILNVTDAVIATATGTSSGTFTVAGFASSLTYPTTVEEGQATTAGTKFIIDPGAVNAGSTSINPIYGNSTGGTLSIVGAAASGTLPIGAGTRQGVVIFVTRNGLYTAPSPPATFTVAQDANYLTASNIPLGPPNVIARLIALTEAGQNGVPGANFYTTTVPTIFTVGGVQYTSSSFLIPDNLTTTARFTFSDAVLLNGDAIDVQGNNLFNLIEIGNPAWILQYADRTVYGGCQNKIQNFNNLSFDGGYLQPTGATSAVPLGWNIDPNYSFSADASVVQLRVSPVFGNSLYVINNTGSEQNLIGMITQSAYQDAWFEPILKANTSYSVRVTCRTPSGAVLGNIVVDLVASNNSVYGSEYGAFVLPLSEITTTMATYTGLLLGGNGFTTVPVGLLVRVWGQNTASLGDFEVDRVEIFPTSQPILTNVALVSYAEEPEQVDGVTGQITLSSQGFDQVMGGLIIHETLYFQKESSLIEVEDAPNYEPSQWTTRSVSRKIGTVGPNAFDYGDDWGITLDRKGFHTFTGGVPEPIDRELHAFATGDSFWDTINWSAEQTFWLANDLRQRRFYAGVAMKTPNFWLPNAPVNANPTQPNVILLCNYEGCPTAAELQESSPVHVTMFGAVKALDLRRKWSIWQIESPYGGVVLDGAQLFDTLFLGNGIATGKIYRLMAPDIQMTDDGTPIAPLYTTYGFTGMLEGQQKQVGAGQKLATKWMANVSGSGSLEIRFYPNTLSATYPQTNPLKAVLSSNPQNNIERRLEVRGQRVFVEISMNQTGTLEPGYFEQSEMMLEMVEHPWGAWRGVAQ